MLVKRVKKLYEIDPKSWEHPADKAALSALKQLRGIDELIKLLVSVTTERSLKLMALSSSIKVSRNQYPKLHTILNNVVDTFDWDYTPSLFVTQSPFWNAGVMGVKEPFIIINSSMIKNFEENEVTAIIAHELGHIMSGHALYKTLMWLLTKISLNFIPMASLLITPIIIALYEWDRKSELTADRAKLLAVQDPVISYNILMKMAGAEDLTQVNLNDFFTQAQEYESQKTLLDGIHKILNQLWASHPFPVIRLQELKSWELSGYYQTILDGNYLRRGLHQANTNEDIRAGYEYYKETWKNKDDTLSKVASDVGEELEKVVEGIGRAAEGIGDTIKDIFRKNNT
ncbi:MAG: M48 family metallopeptidase [Treponema sp.]|jgi:Zn-dependent protease with chaperone function|nr:M48 family metallopeptidase [Treponema sp.]